MQQVGVIGWRMSIAAKAVRAYADQQMALEGFSLTVAIVTRILSARPDLTQRQLADALGIEAPTMARHIDRLERDGIVSRRRDAADRRVLRVRLTDKGDELRDRLVGVSTHTHAQLTSVFEPDELSLFESYLDRLAAHAAALLDGAQLERTRVDGGRAAEGPAAEGPGDGVREVIAR